MSAQPTRLQRILGGGGEDEALQAARGAMTAFERVWGGTRLLAADHPARAQQLELFVTAVAAYVADHGDLELDVAPFAFTIDGMEVLKIDRARENYIYRLYQDGVRRLWFTAALNAADFERFLSLLRTNFTDPNFLEDDLVTLMWSAEIDGIGYRAVEVIGAGEDDLSKQRTDLPSVDELLAMAASAVAPAGLAGTDTDIDEDTLAQQALQTSTRTHPNAAKAAQLTFGLSDAEAAKLCEQLVAEDGALGAKLGEVLFRCRAALGDAAHEHVLNAFGDFAEESVVARQTTPLLQALGAAQGLGKAAGADVIRDAFFARLGQPATVRPLVERFAEAGSAELDPATEKLLQAIAAFCFGVLWQQAFELLPPPQRKLLLRHLEPHAPKNGTFLAKQAGEGTEESAVAALALLRKLDVTAIAQELLGGLRHTSAAVRIDTAMTLRKVDDPVVKRALTFVVNDSDESVRLQGYQVLGQIGGPEVEATLMGIVGDPQFTDRSEDEQTRAIASLGRIASTRGLGLVRRLAVTDIDAKLARGAQLAAIKVLAQRKDLDATKGLRRITGKVFGSKEIKAAAKEALDRIESGDKERGS